MKPLAVALSLTDDQRAADAEALRAKYAGLPVEVHESTHRLRNHGARVEVRMVVVVKRRKEVV